MGLFSRRESKTQATRASGPQEIFTRAERYKLKAPIRYRRTGTMSWRSGSTVNLSKSGFLFLSDVPLPAGTSIEVEITLPQKGNNGEPRMLSASAVVTAERQLEKGEKGSRVAARITRSAL